MAVAAFGAELWVDNSGGTLTQIAEVLSVTPPSLTRATLDTTHHATASGIQTFIGSGIADPGEISATIHYVAGSASDDLLLEAVGAGTARSFKVVVNAASGQEAISGDVIVTGYAPDSSEIDGKQTATVTMKVSGALTQGVES